MLKKDVEKKESVISNAKRDIIRMEFEKLYKMPALYALVVMSIAFNIFLLVDVKGGSFSHIRYDSVHLEEAAESYAYDYYEDFRADQIQKLASGFASYRGITEELIRKNYQKLDIRAHEMTEAEKNSVSFTGVYKLQDLLFGSLFRYLLMEGGLLIFLTVLYSMHYEKFHRTEDIAFVSKTGRNLFAVKHLVSGLYALLLCAIVVVVTLSVYFVLIDYSGIWGSFISSNYNADKRTVNDLYLTVYPYITWIPLTIAQYLWAVLGVMMALYLFMVVVTGILCQKMKNSIIVLAVVFILVFALYFIGNGIHTASMLEYILKLNPVHLVMKSGYWFMDYAPGDSYPWYELLTIVVWNGIAAVGMWVVRRARQK